MSEIPTPDRVVCVDLEPVGRRVELAAGKTVLDAARMSGVEIVAACGGIGSCDTCRVQLMEGELSPATLTEQSTLDEVDLQGGFRLACQAELRTDARIAIPPESLAAPQRLQLEGQHVTIEPDPLVVPVDISIPPPTVHDVRADTTRMTAALADQGRLAPDISLRMMPEVAHRLRLQDWKARLALYRNTHVEELVAVLPPGASLLGLALDLGTTKLAAYLVDVGSGETLAKAGAVNPQTAYGEDVVTRIEYTNREEENQGVLQAGLVEAIATLVDTLCAEAGVSRNQIVDVVAVGNTAMHHLFAGLPVRQLGEAPYVPVTTDPLSVLARSVGLHVASGAYVYLPPIVAGYVGSDHVAMLLATDVWQSGQTVVALDIGTNTEISLLADGRLLSCSCASGPAFEGAHIVDGMRAMPGAIERLRVADDAFHAHTIGGQRPIGICGSGILDAVAAMRSTELLDERGSFQADAGSVRDRNGRTECVLVPAHDTGHGRDIVVTRRDVNEIQLAKGAIRAGIEVLLAEAQVRHSDVDLFVVAGAFGTYLDLESAIQVGMFPALPVARFRQVGNAAGMGALNLLLSARYRRIATDLVKRIEYVELSAHPRFSDAFTEALFLRKDTPPDSHGERLTALPGIN